MRRAMCMVGLAAGVALMGCSKPAVREKPLPDPLLTSKKPIEGSARLAEPASRVEEMPPPPPMPLGR